MPSIKAPGKILVTVVGTVRSLAKGEEISNYFLQYGNEFSYTIVKDISQPGAFDEIISTGRFDGVAHTAAPVPTHNTESDRFKAATKGVRSILESIKTHGPTVKRVVLMSSGLAATQLDPSILITEAHWNDAIVKLVEEKGDKASDFERYAASKVISERAAWKFVEDSGDEINFDLVAILPTAVLGAPVNQNTPADQLGAASLVFQELQTARPESELGGAFISIVHVKDVAAIHSECFLQERAGGHRVFAASAQPSWQDMYNALNEEPAFPGVPKGKPGVGQRPDDETSEYDMTFAKELLGRKLVGAKETLREAARYHQGAGWEFACA